MLDLKRIQENKEKVTELLARKGYKADFDAVLALDAERRKAIGEVEALKAERNKVSAEIPKLKKEGKPVEGIFAEMRELGDKIAEYDKKANELDKKVFDMLAVMPNIPDEDLLPGEKENNKVVKVFGEKPEFSFPMQNHVDLCTKLGIIDYQRGTKLSGGGFWLYRGEGARLEWALLNFFISEHLKDGYEFILPPHQLGYNCGFGAGQFPKFSDEVYWLDCDEDRTKNRFMLPTAETALVNMYAGEIIPEEKLPMKFFAYTPCYRKEAGSYRAEERGMIRGHQFNKVEMVQYAHPEHSMEAFEELVNKACSLMEKLGLHFRLSKLAAGDCSASMARTYDIEVWIPSMGIYKEVSSVSNANDYQARRNNTKFRDSKTGKPQYVHTLNGSGLATSRVFPAIIEQYQNADGSITIPEVLQPFMGGQKVIK
ncbi:MAG: serine--tRNA ligase [Candidatus Borkfalkiaceae bacterium]|nr:serine--tRNA ligase [Christensenellaceae bacterium]